MPGGEHLVGVVSGYLEDRGAALVELFDFVMVGDIVHILGGRHDFEQRVEEMEFDRHPVPNGGPGETVCLKVNQPVDVQDELYAAD